MADSRMLVSEYVSENREKDRQIARACNIAKWMLDNFRLGERVSAKDIRNNIPQQVKDTTLDAKGDLKAHGCAVNALDLGRLTRDGEMLVDFSLPNLKRCASWILGQGQKVGAIKLLKDEVTQECVQEDNELIDLAMEIPTENFTEWERIFVFSLNKNWRERGLSLKQRTRLLKVIEERS
jgi:hypothetical protein